MSGVEWLTILSEVEGQDGQDLKDFFRPPEESEKSSIRYAE